MDDSGEVTRIVRIVVVVELKLSANPLKRRRKSETIMAAAAHTCSGKAKNKVEKTYEEKTSSECVKNSTKLAGCLAKF